tara:strand:+ start:42 stop:293 length:252 start_codon:yes stop_codon:yes gene_type:complete
LINRNWGCFWRKSGVESENAPLDRLSSILTGSTMDITHLMEWMMLLAGINIVLSTMVLLFGFKKPKEEPEFKPVEFDWLKEGF